MTSSKSLVRQQTKKPSESFFVVLLNFLTTGRSGIKLSFYFSNVDNPVVIIGLNIRRLAERLWVRVPSGLEDESILRCSQKLHH